MLTLDTQNLRMIVFLLLSAFGFATCVIALSVYYEVNNPGADSTALMLTLLLVPILLATAILLPGLSLVLFAIAGRFDLEPLMSDWTDVAFWIAASLLLVLPVYVQRYRLSVVIRHPIAVAFAVFTIVLSVSAIGMQGYEYPLEKTYRVLLLCSLLFLLPLFVIRKQSDVTRFFAALVAVATTMGLVSLGLALQGSSLPDIQRLAPPGGGPIPFARALGLATIAAIGLSLLQPRLRWIYRILAVALVGMCFLTASRGPFLFLIAAVILLIAFLLASRGTRRSMFAGLIAMSVLVASAGVVTSLGETSELERPKVLSRYELLLQTNRGGSVSVREDMYAIAIDHFTPLGYGMGTWPLLVDGMDHESYPHNIFLELLFEQGIPGLAAFVGLVSIVSVYSLRHMRLAPSETFRVLLIIGYISLLYSTMVAQTSGDLYDNRTIWLFAGIVLVTIVLCDDSQREEGGLLTSKSGEQ